MSEEAHAARTELERRWRITRIFMSEHRIEALVAYARDDYLGGYVRWFTDAAAFLYPKAIVFHQSDLMTLVDHGPEGGRRVLDGATKGYSGVGELLTTAEFPSAAQTGGYTGTLIGRAIAARGYRRIALVGLQAMPQGFVEALRTSAPYIETVDATDFVDCAKARKSPIEIEMMRATARMQDAVFQRVLASTKPGMRESDVAALARYEGALLGSEQGVFMCRAAPLGTPLPATRGAPFESRILQAGDYFSILIENSGVGGYYTELGRTCVLGKVPPSLAAAFEQAVGAQCHTAAALRHGATGASVYRQHADFMRSLSQSPSRRIYSHGQGFDLVERPLIREDEPMSIEPAMCFAIHPTAVVRGNAAFVCDNFLVGEREGEWLHQTQKRLFEIV